MIELPVVDSVVAAILAVGAVATVMFLCSFFAIRRARVDPEDFSAGVANILSKGGKEEAIAVCEETRGPAAAAVAAILRAPCSNADDLRRLGEAAGDAACNALDRHLAPVAVVAQTAPLLGLAGTVYGMLRIVAMASGEALVSRPELMDGVASTLASAGAGFIVSAAAHAMFAVLDHSARRLAGEVRFATAAVCAALCAVKGNGGDGR